MIVLEHATLREKLAILSDAAKYDVACTSSGVERQSRPGELGNSCAAGICHSFAADGRCISLLKILMTNECIYNCKYCINRVSNDIPRTAFTPEEICTLTIEFYRRNYIEGLFLSSGIVESPDRTMELMTVALRDLRKKYRFNGYIHCKAIPGASPEIVEECGWYADRMSINLELPTADGLRELAPNKTRKKILTPMRMIQAGMAESRELLGMTGGNRSAYYFTQQRIGHETPGLSVDNAVHQLVGEATRTRSVTSESNKESTDSVSELNSYEPKGTHTRQAGVSGTVSGSDSVHSGSTPDFRPDSCHSDESVNRRSYQKLSGITSSQYSANSSDSELTVHNHSKSGSILTGLARRDLRHGFVPAGQSTQMIIGATGESDYQIMAVTEALYRNFDLKRVFFSAFMNVNNDSTLPSTLNGPPLLREHRLYQADFLLRYYGFSTDDLLSEKRPFFNPFLDPKCDWALAHMELFPIEVSTAGYDTLLKVPGIGAKSARRIVDARRQGRIDFASLKTAGVVLKRAIYFITCYGKMFSLFLKQDEDFITRQLLHDNKDVMTDFGSGVTYKQLSFDDIWSDYGQNNNLISQCT